MLNDLLSIGKFVFETASSHQENQSRNASLLRMLRIELSTNLNLITTVQKQLAKTTTEMSPESISWLLKSLSVSAVSAFLLTDELFVNRVDADMYLDEEPAKYQLLPKNLEFILIKLEEMKALCNAPVGAPIGDIRWKQRVGFVKDAHVRAIRALSRKANTENDSVRQ